MGYCWHAVSVRCVQGAHCSQLSIKTQHFPCRLPNSSLGAMFVCPMFKLRGSEYEETREKKHQPLLVHIYPRHSTRGERKVCHFAQSVRGWLSGVVASPKPKKRGPLTQQSCNLKLPLSSQSRSGTSTTFTFVPNKSQPTSYIPDLVVNQGSTVASTPIPGLASWGPVHHLPAAVRPHLGTPPQVFEPTTGP